MKQCSYVILKPRADKRLADGHPWIYDNEIADVKGEPGNGSRIQVFSAGKQFLGSALWSQNSRIKARRYSFLDDEFSPELIQARLVDALEKRKSCYRTDSESCRLVFGEADGLPGLIVDQYAGQPIQNPTASPIPNPTPKPTTGKQRSGRWLTVQLLFAGLQPHRAAVLRALVKIFQPDGIFERSEAAVLAKEGLKPECGLLFGQVPETIAIVENKLQFLVHPGSGQKTGWFLDQRDNRAACARYAAGGRVLDICCNAGGFSLCAASAGATQVRAVDSSAAALADLAANARLNGLEGRIETIQADVFDYLRNDSAHQAAYDLIIVDPPAFAKNRTALPGALRGYKELNLQALKRLKPGGILASFTCSYWISRDLLRQSIDGAALDAGQNLEYLEDLQQAPDHPVLPSYPESQYLKGFIIRAGA